MVGTIFSRSVCRSWFFQLNWTKAKPRWLRRWFFFNNRGRKLYQNVIVDLVVIRSPAGKFVAILVPLVVQRLAAK